MRTLIRLAAGPLIIPTYTLWGAVVGKNRAGVFRGALAGWAMGCNYILTGQHLLDQMDEGV